jgi:hypothetical protein
MKPVSKASERYVRYLDRRIDLKDHMRGSIVAAECARVKVIEAMNEIFMQANPPPSILFFDHLDEALAAINEMEFGLISIASHLGIAGLYAIKTTPKTTVQLADL